MDQISFPFYLDEDALGTFLTQYVAIEHAQEQMREAMRLLLDQYQAVLPVAAILQAVTVVRAQAWDAAHPPAPLHRVHQTHVEGVVRAHLARLAGEGAAPDMTG